MAQTRKDLRGRVLRKGESQRRSDERYVYTYTDPLGRRKYVYAQDLVTLREKEAQLMKDQMDGLDIYVADKGIRVVKNTCPVDGSTKRAYAKQLMEQINRETPGAKDRIMHAIVNGRFPDWPL